MNDTLPKNLVEAKALLEAKMIEVLATFENHYKKPMPIPNIVFHELGLTFGTANNALNRIRLNSELVLRSQKHWDDMLNDTLPHEVCHFVAPLIHNNYQHGNYRSHGRSWQECMVVIGLPPKRCGQMDNETRQAVAKRVVERKYAYKCSCSELHYLTKIRHNRVQTGQYNRLHCRLCKTTLTYVGEKIS